MEHWSKSYNKSPDSHHECPIHRDYDLHKQQLAKHKDRKFKVQVEVKSHDQDILML